MALSINHSLIHPSQEEADTGIISQFVLMKMKIGGKINRKIGK